MTEELKTRATTNELKQEVVQRLLVAWCKAPELRLGQLIENALGNDVFYIEDFSFVEGIEQEVKGWTVEAS